MHSLLRIPLLKSVDENVICSSIRRLGKLAGKICQYSLLVGCGCGCGWGFGRVLKRLPVPEALFNEANSSSNSRSFSL